MPLPENQQIAVKPNAAEVRNKHAITLRMSEDLIEALMANPGNLSFEFNTPNQVRLHASPPKRRLNAAVLGYLRQ